MFGIDDLAVAGIVSAGANVVGDLFSQSNARDAFKSRYQDTVADMRKAGLNPALAYGQGGGNPQTMSFGDWGTSAAQAAGAIAQAKQAKAQTAKTQAEASLLNAQSANLIERSGLINANLTSQGHLLDKTAALRGWEADYARDAMPDRLRSVKSAADLMRMRAVLAGLSEPEARAYAKYYSGAIGRAEPYINTAKGVVGAITGAAKDAAGARFQNSWRRR